MKRKPRPKTKPTADKGEATTFWIRPANRKGLRDLSATTGTSVSYLINRAITRFLVNPQSLFFPEYHTNHTLKESEK